jgi:hypothetical protein
MTRMLANHLLIRIANSAPCGLIAVRTYLQGGLRRASVIERIELALRANDLASYITAQGAYPNAPLIADASGDPGTPGWRA